MLNNFKEWLMVENHNCINCGKPIGDSDMVCPHCGFKFGPNDEEVRDSIKNAARKPVRNFYATPELNTSEIPSAHARKLTNLLGIQTLKDLSLWSVEDLANSRPGRRLLDNHTLDTIRTFLHQAGLTLKGDHGPAHSNN